MSSDPASTVKSILPPPFDWCEIPAGRVKLTHRGARSRGTAFDVPAFYIAKYPVTNAQYARFIEADGYNNSQWWSEEGWQARTQDLQWNIRASADLPTGIAWTGPRDWQNPLFNGAEQPVVNVSWYEAMGFCQWLSQVSGENIVLPTQQQWQRAAQGDKGHAYPWGSAWDPNRCNHHIGQTGVGRTTPVTQYEGRGDSPFGVVDMAGNACEWVFSEPSPYGVGLTADYRKHCGMPWWGSGMRSFRVDDVHSSHPYLRGNMFGFRIARVDEPA